MKCDGGSRKFLLVDFARSFEVCTQAAIAFQKEVASLELAFDSRRGKDGLPILPPYLHS